MATDLLTGWVESPRASDFPYADVLGAYLERGKHFVKEDLVERLVAARAVVGRAQGEPRELCVLAQFLDVLLDKHDRHYDYPSYLALAMLPMANSERPWKGSLDEAEGRWARAFCSLVVDLLCFELDALDGKPVPLPQMRPDAALVSKRCLLALRAAAPALQRLGLEPALFERTGHPNEHRDRDDIEVARQVCRRAEALWNQEERRSLRLSMLPVYTLHDEYLFLRTLQSFETTFALMAVAIRKVIAALLEGDAERATAGLRLATRTLLEVAPMFSLLATMRVEAFRDFRQYTEGASAIQSRGYKTLESLCRCPDAERRDSLAYLSVPEVRERVLAHQATVSETLAFAFHSGRIVGPALEKVEAAATGLEVALLHWRKTHYRLAVRMLGDSTGTGYSEGTPYLRSVMEKPVFDHVQSCPESGASRCPF